MDGIAACKWKRPNVSSVEKPWNLKATAPGGFMDWKATAGWKEPITPARIAKGRRFFPLDVKLKLRADHWSEGAARVAARQGLQAKSFDKAAESYSDATGGSMSKDSLLRITEGFGQRLEDKRASEAQKVYAPQAPQLAQQVVTVTTPIKQQANISTDGGMILLREEGWKEFKMSVVSEVRGKAVKPSPTEAHPDPRITLLRHSYQAGLWTADQMGQHQYLEGARRQVERCVRLGSANDGAVWISRITTSNYSQIVYSIDWAHAHGRLSNVAKAAFGDGTPQAQQWTQQQVELLWHGRVEDVVTALQVLDWNQITCLEDIRNSPSYFETRKHNMDYARLRSEGYPIGSGTVESGINTVVHHRMKRQGRGWKRQHAQAMMAALGELHSDRFQTAWQATC